MLLEAYLHKILYDPDHGYYARSHVVGPQGDFITAPEISPLFSLCIAQWVVDQWTNLGQPRPINLVELGAGCGTMMSTLLQSLKQIPNLYQSLTAYILEASQPLKAQQSKTLKDHPIKWIDNLNQVPNAFTIILANEFFDALPIQYYRSQDNTPQVLTVEANQLNWVDCEPDGQPDGIYYRSKLYEQFVEQISRILQDNSGIGLIIDYGSHSPGFTLQAVKNHKKVGLFDHVGQADITHHVDFDYLTNLFQTHDITTLGPIPQGQFLKELGIDNIVHQMKDLPGYKNHLLSVHRLISSQEMGDLFKVIAIYGGSHA